MKKAIKKTTAKKSLAKVKNNSKPLPKAQNGGKATYSSKYQSSNDLSSSYSKAYKTTKDGKVISRSSAAYPARRISGELTTSYPESTTVLDTSGYSKGKKSFPAKKTTYNIAEANYDFNPNDPNSKVGRTTYSEWNVPRSQVKKTITEMKSNSGADKSKGTKVNYNSSGTKTVVHTAKDGTKYVKVTTKDGKTYNKVIKMEKGGTKATTKKYAKGGKKYEIGGMSGDSCGPKDPKCGYKKAQRKNKRQKNMRNFTEKVLKPIGKTMGGLALATGAALGINKAVQEFKKGGVKVESKKGMGFSAAQKAIAKKQGISMERAGAILASATRKASPKAKAKNPNLKKVKMPKKK